jgi:hypothetical protein
MDPPVPVPSRFPVGVRDDGKLLLIIPTRFVRWNFPVIPRNNYQIFLISARAGGYSSFYDVRDSMRCTECTG